MCAANWPSTWAACSTPNAATAAHGRDQGADLFRQAVLALRWFRQNTDITALARDHGISRATGYRYLDEVVTVLAEQAPDLRDTLQRAKDEAMPYVILDGKIFYEPTFSDRSHGFRPGRGCHTALREVTNTWTGTTWFIEGDVSDCFGSFDHSIMLSTLAEKIHDNRFLDHHRQRRWRRTQLFGNAAQGVQRPPHSPM